MGTMKEIVKTMNPKKMKASELAEVIYDNQKDLISFYIKEAHNPKNADVVDALYAKMLNKKFVKALGKIIKGSDEKDALDCGFVVIIAGFIEKNHNNEELNEELLTAYTEIINKLLKSRVKKVNKKLNLNEDVVKELLLITPDVGYISNDKFVGIYSQKMLRKLYFMSKDMDTGISETSQVEKMFKKLFGKELLDLIAINVLLEKKEFLKNFNEAQTNMWNLMTNFALEYINNQDKDHVTELIEYYCARRRSDANKNRDGARRINLASVDAELYPKFAKAVAKFKKNGKSSLVEFM